MLLLSNGRPPLTAIFDNDGHRICFCHDEDGRLGDIRHSGGTDERVELVHCSDNRELRLAEAINSPGQSIRETWSRDAGGGAAARSLLAQRWRDRRVSLARGVARRSRELASR